MTGLRPRSSEPLSIVYLARAGDGRDAVERALRGVGLHVLSAGTQQEAAELLAATTCPLCLIDLAGADAVRTIRAIRHSGPRVVVLGLADPKRPDVAALGLQAGCADVVAQPLEGADLAVVLANAREATLLPDGACPDGDAPVELVGLSAAIREFNELLDHAAAARCHVLIIAEGGFDSEAVAREIHRRSSAAASPFVPLDCAGAEAMALERALLGSRGPNGRGAEDLEVVGGDALLLAAGHGTLFLGNISELPASMQVRLARIARDGELRVADSTTGAGVPRIVASTPPAIDGELEDGRFRPDFYRRLGILRLTLPPLRERPEDVPALAARLSRTLCANGGFVSRRFTNGALTLLSALPWPGNIEELSGVLSGVLAMPGSEVIGLDELLQHLRFDAAATRVAPNGSLSAARTRFEREYIAAVLHRHRWRMADAARALGIQRPNLYRKTRQLGITRTKRLP